MGLDGYIVNGSAVYTWDSGAGVWRHIPDVDTANAMGLDWNALTQIDYIPEPTGDDWPSGYSGQETAAPSPSPVGIPPGFTAGDFGGPTDVETLAQTEAGRQVLIDAGMNPADVAMIAAAVQSSSGTGAGSGDDDGGDDTEPDDIFSFFYGQDVTDLVGMGEVSAEVGQKISIAGSWRGLLDTLAYGFPALAAATRASSSRLMDKVGG